MSDHLIREFGALLDSEGRLLEPGYATAPVLRYDRSQVRAARWRIRSGTTTWSTTTTTPWR